MDMDSPDTPTISEATEAQGPSFNDFGLSSALLKGTEEAGFITPSPIQQQAIPVIMSGADMVGQAHTGTGKTAAFGLAGMSMFEFTGDVEMLVITPTRELATQVSEEIYRLGRFAKVETVAIYGGQPYGRQIERVSRGVQVVVATPGRLLDLLEGGKIRKRFTPKLVVLDEADEMLDMGFLDDIKKILAFLPEERQTLLFSATIPGPIRELANKFLKDPTFISVNPKEATVKEIQQHYYIIADHERDDATMRLIDSLETTKSIIFCRTKSEVDRISTMMVGRGYFAKGLHGDMEQSQREEVIGSFRAGRLHILVATDIAARGLDVADVSHVFNYHIPFDSESYVHRIGRTGRAGRKGMAITLVTPSEYNNLRRIQGMVGRIQQSFIPTLRELRKATAARLMEEVREQESLPTATKMIQELSGEMEPTELASRLLSLLLKREVMTGPDRIGLDDAQIKRMLQYNGPQGNKRHIPSRPGGARAGAPWTRHASGGYGNKKRWNKG